MDIPIKRTRFGIVLLFVFLCGCNSYMDQDVFIEKESWGEANDKPVSLFTLTNKNGMAIRVTNYGGILTDVRVPDKNGKVESVVLGFDSLKSYVAGHPNFGTIVGRYANRIGNAAFNLNGKEYKLTANFKGHCLHGGNNGFSRQVFEVDTFYFVKDTSKVVFCYLSADMEEGFPGNLAFRLTYALTNNNEIILEYEASTDKPTVVNFTNHSYFNLTGCADQILNHSLLVYADSITPVDSDGIPTGMIVPVSGTAYDFTHFRKVGERIEEISPGYDINYKLRKTENELSLAAEVFDSTSGRFLQAYTTEPGMQLYSASMDLSFFTGHEGKKYGTYYGLCLEMQHFPDSPNQPVFPNVILNPGETYNQTTVYQFSIRR